jgi:hypothetical protein
VSTEHTKGRAIYATGPAYNGQYHAIHAESGDLICECYEGSEEEQRANAKRIQACWNACLEFSTETLVDLCSGGVPSLHEYFVRQREMKQQNADLVGALKAFYYRIEPKQIEGAFVPFKGEFSAEVCEQALAALTRAGVKA